MITSRFLRRLTPEDVRHWRTRARAVDPTTLDAARDILSDIDARGDAAVLDHARRLGDLSQGSRVMYSGADLAAARGRLPAAHRELLERAAGRIRGFALAQRACLHDLSFPIPGGRAGHTCIPVRTAGCYAPGGRFPLPSSVLMTAVTARAAGVERVLVASPRPTDVTLAAASIAGADGLLAMGGVQAIAALARGLVGAPACELTGGPGNRWVTAAKHLVSNDVGIDMLAGPSELLVLADATADPAVIAADLLAQAEHDDDAVPMLITTHEPLIDRVEAELARQLTDLPTRVTARAALQNGFVTLVANAAQAVRLSDQVAPEHLELITQDAEALAADVRNAGAVFIGPLSAEVLGDYGAGPNHVLPTGGTARFSAGLSVLTFLRARTWMHVEDRAAALPMATDAAARARLESLEAHARAAEQRVNAAASGGEG